MSTSSAWLDFRYNSQLYCINVDNSAWATANWTVSNGNISSWNSFSGDCNNEVLGCADSLAFNFDSLVTINNFNCDFGMTYVPDTNFQQALIDLGIDTDSILNDSVATASIKFLTSLNVYNKSISDLTGIEDFDSLQTLYCYSNQLTSFDVSNNTALTQLQCQYNQLDSLDVSANLALTQLQCQYNQLDSLDVSTNTALTTLVCFSNQLTTLDVSANLALTQLQCQYNQLDSLDVSTNTALTYLYCYSNQLTSLDVSANLALTQLQCQYNQLDSLDVSTNTALTYLYCYNNQLTSLDVSANLALTQLQCQYNQLTSLDVSANTALSRLRCQNNQLTSLDLRNGNNTNIYTSSYYLDLTNNPQLYCIDVDDPVYSTANWTVANGNISWWNGFSNNCATAIYGCTDSLAYNYDPMATLNYGCDYGMTYVPDTNFQQALIDLGIDTDSILNDSVATANIKFLTYLNVSYNSISDLTGIEDFTSLTSLSCYNNQLTILDVSTNTALTSLSCYSNQLSSLDVSANLALTQLQCQYNQLDSLDVSTNTALTYLYCYNNQLDSLDVSTNTALTNLQCYSNQLTSLDVSNNTALQILACYNNQLTSLDLRNGNNTNIYTSSYYLNLTNNPQLYCIDVDSAAYSTANWTVANGNISLWNVFSNDCAVIYGCTDTLACNYNSAATVDDVSCAYGNTYTTILFACDSHDWNGQSITATGSYSQTFTNASGCDSVHTLVATIGNSNTGNSDETTCESFDWNGQVITTTGSYNQTFTNAGGCDSVHTLNFTINNSPNTSIIVGPNQTSFFSIETYIVSQVIGSVFSWEVTGGAIMTGQNTNVVDVAWGDISGAYELCVTETDMNGCSNTVCLTVSLGIASNIEDQMSTNSKKLVMITDVLGKETPYKRNTTLFYIYDDGTVEKRIAIE